MLLSLFDDLLNFESNCQELFADITFEPLLLDNLTQYLLRKNISLILPILVFIFIVFNFLASLSHPYIRRCLARIQNGGKVVHA